MKAALGADYCPLAAVTQDGPVLASILAPGWSARRTTNPPCARTR